MKVWKKFSAITLALMMVMALTVIASADDTKSDNTANASGGINAVTGAENTIQIAKEIIFINDAATSVREPNITYTYTISAVAEASLKDSSNNVATVTGPLVSDANTNMTTTVKPGVIGAVSATTSTVAFADTNAKISATSSGTSDRKYASFAFTPATFTAAGIYRYKITESVDTDARANVGITSAATYAADRYLDVYVKWSDDSHTTPAIYGYVLFEGDSYAQLNASTTKSAGYVNTGSGTQADVDVYTTYNLLITGKTTGSLADLNHDFPVAITLTKATGLADSIKLDFAVTNNGSLTKTGTDSSSVDYVTMDAALSGTVRNGSTISITGIPKDSTVTMTETNDTADDYKVKVGTAADGAQSLAEATVTKGSTSSDTSSSTFNASVSLFITNTLDAISPTGVTLRFAPYLAMMGAGIVALPLSLRKKEELF